MSEVQKTADHDEKQKDVQYHKYLYRFTMGFITLSAIVSLYIALQIIFPSKILELPSTVMTVNKDVVRAGDTITMHTNYCKNKDIPSDLEIGFVDGQLSDSFNTFRNLPLGCHKATFRIEVPIDLQPDTYHVEMNIRYSAAFLTDEEHNLRSERFKVLRAKKDPATVLIQECIDQTSNRSVLRIRTENGQTAPALLSDNTEVHATSQNPSPSVPQESHPVRDFISSVGDTLGNTVKEVGEFIGLGE